MNQKALIIVISSSLCSFRAKEIFGSKFCCVNVYEQIIIVKVEAAETVCIVTRKVIAYRFIFF